MSSPKVFFLTDFNYYSDSIVRSYLCAYSQDKIEQFIQFGYSKELSNAVQFIEKTAYDSLVSDIAKMQDEKKRDQSLSTGIHWKVCKERDALAAELERVKAQNEIMKVALHGLNNEVVAMLVTHGDVIAQDYGRTNLECVEYRLKIAREALAKVSQVNLNTHPESEEVW